MGGTWESESSLECCLKPRPTAHRAGMQRGTSRKKLRALQLGAQTWSPASVLELGEGSLGGFAPIQDALFGRGFRRFLQKRLQALVRTGFSFGRHCPARVETQQYKLAISGSLGAVVSSFSSKQIPQADSPPCPKGAKKSLGEEEEVGGHGAGSAHRGHREESVLRPCASQDQRKKLKRVSRRRGRGLVPRVVFRHPGTQQSTNH